MSNIKIPHCNKCKENDKGMCVIDMSVIKDNIFWCPFYSEDLNKKGVENVKIINQRSDRKY